MRHHIRYTMPHKARLLFRHRHVFADCALVEMKAWSVPPSSRTPEGVKYSLVYIDADGRRVLGFDNAEGKGHHRHDLDEEAAFTFDTVEGLIDVFLEEVARIRGMQP
jgi:hypothetical protein